MSSEVAPKQEPIVHPYQLKSIEFSERMSEETNCFSANLYAGKRKIASASNRGCGGPTDVWFVDSAAQAEVEAYCASLPVRDIWNFGDERGDIEYRWDAEGLVDDLLRSWLEEKEAKRYLAKMQRDAKTKLLVVINDEDPALSYSYYPKRVYGEIVQTKTGLRLPAQDYFREVLTAIGEKNIRFYDPEIREWV